MVGLGGSGWIALVIAGLWLAIAAAILVLAARRMREANGVVAAATSMSALLDVSPARPLLIRPDRTIDADQRLLRELGLDPSTSRWDGLSGENAGVREEDLASLTLAIDAASLSGTSIQQ